MPGQVVLRLPAGRPCYARQPLAPRAADPARGTIRRLLLFGYGPAWQKTSIYGEKPADGLTVKLLETADEETRALLGVAGYM